jgi:hypothetical protein
VNWFDAATPAPGLSGDFSTQVAVLLFAAVLGGGLFTGLGNFIRARTSSKQVKLDTDPNSPRVAIGGAETAVILMGLTLKSLQGENERLTSRVAHLEEENEALRADVLLLKDRLGIPHDPAPTPT